MLRFIIFAFIVFIVSVALLFGFYEGRQQIRKEAIEHGYAHWQVNLDGWVFFIWNEK
jgi:hypothetical protein